MCYIGEMIQGLQAEMFSSHLLCGSVFMVPVIIFLDVTRGNIYKLLFLHSHSQVQLADYFLVL